MPVADDDVVIGLDAERSGDGRELIGHVDVGGWRRRIVQGVTVHQHAGRHDVRFRDTTANTLTAQMSWLSAEVDMPMGPLASQQAVTAKKQSGIR